MAVGGRSEIRVLVDAPDLREPYATRCALAVAGYATADPALRWHLIPWSRQALGAPDLRRARREGIRGAIAIVPDAAEAARFRAAGIALVNIGGLCPPEACPTVTNDNLIAGRMAAEHLVSAGCNDLLYFGSRTVGSAARLAGFREGASALGHRVTGAFRREASRAFALHRPRFERQLVRTLERMLATARRPAGIFCYNDELACALLPALRTAGLAVPRDACVLGMDNDEVFCLSATPALSSIEQDAGAIGRLACARLAALLDTPPPPRAPPAFVPPGRLVTRNSTDRIAVRDPAVAAALQFIHIRHPTPIDVGAVTANVPLSRRCFESRFRAIVGTSPYDYILGLRIAHARARLADTGDSIRRVAAACGFGGVSSFLRVFERRTGLSPKEYRRRYADRPPTAHPP